MERMPVQSSLVQSVGYDPTSAVLEVELHNGKIYQYRDVPRSVFDGLMASSSKGDYFNANIRTKYEHERIFGQ
jgi:hypothetical protein